MENAAHSDFLLLRNMLVRTHMQDLKDVTREIHYENYRAQCIQNMTRMVVLERKRRWVETGCTNTDRHSPASRFLQLYVCLCVNLGFSLREKYQDGGEADFPLPLAITDTEKERLIYEKDEEVCFTLLLHPLSNVVVSVISTSLFICLFQLRKMQEVLERIQEQMQQSQRGGC